MYVCMYVDMYMYTHMQTFVRGDLECGVRGIGVKVWTFRA